MNKDQVAKVGAKWWADRLRELPESDFGDRTINFVTELKKHMMSSKTGKPTEGQITQFQNELELFLLNMVSEMSQGDWNTIGVDYKPDKILRDIAENVEIDPIFFPAKTTMWIRPTQITVSLGYGGQIEAITE